MWAVDDSFAVPFMQRFYEYARIHPRSVALQKTQIDSLEGRFGWKENETPPPILWAGFQLYG
jgi:CHAT domain-containing protein